MARSVRQALKKKHTLGAVPVVYSTEKPSIKLLPLEEHKVEEADQYAALPSFRSRILPVLGTIPALFGNAMASYVITELAGFPTDPLSIKGSKRASKNLYNDLVTRERHIEGPDVVMHVSTDDIGFIYEETWKCKSALGGNVGDKLTLIRWDPKKPATFGNIICLTKQQATKHEKYSCVNEFPYSQELLDYVASRFQQESHASSWR